MSDDARLLELEHRIDDLTAEIKRTRHRFRLAAIGLTVAILSGIATPIAAYALAIRSGDIVNGEVKTPDLGADAVTTAKIKDGAVGAAQLKPGVVAAKAYGTVWYPGTSVSDSRNLTVENLFRPSTGIYCIFGLGFTPTGAIGSSTYEWNAGRSDVSIWSAGSQQQQSGCPGNTQVQVRLYSPNSNTLVDSNFNILIY